MFLLCINGELDDDLSILQFKDRQKNCLLRVINAVKSGSNDKIVLLWKITFFFFDF